MKFKAFLTENEVNLLEKRFLPALDKMGKTYHFFSVLFEVVSVFALKLVQLDPLPPNCTQAMPFLTFETKGYKSAVIQDVPISKPLSRAQVLELQTALDMAQDLPPTLVQVPDLNQLQNFVHRMKHVGDLLNVSICKYGDLHLQISTTLITLGAEFRKLLVIGEKAVAPSEDRNLSAQTRSERAISRGDAQSVQVSVKHFSKSLQCHLAKPDCAFYGIAPQGVCLRVIFQFFIPGTRQTDKSISLHCRLPVLDPGT
ncbi:Checkpoint protein [Citrus sinensis]|nr:Checkpoint protein [Citrus sinensis]